jgi:iron complex transport system substrate-binding protein
MPKVCSFLPAVTQMIYDMGLEEHLYGVTFECPPKALKEKLPVVRCILEGKEYSSQEIDHMFSASKNKGEPLYYVDGDVLAKIAPDIIFTQDICDVCQIDTECTAAAVAKLKKRPELISITPSSLEDVFTTAITVASALGKEEYAYHYLERLHKRLDTIVETLLDKKIVPKRVLLLEWMAPLYNCGHWIPHQITYAGGKDFLSNPSGDSGVLPWEKVLEYDPEVMVIAPCGFSMERSMEEIHLLRDRPNWNQLRAVREGSVYLADFELFTQSSASTLVDGIALLAGLFHPGAIDIPTTLRSKYRKL